MGMSSDVPEAPDPAKRPQRDKTVDPEDIVPEDSSEDEAGRGRKALRRPVRNSGGAGTSSGGSVGTGLSA